MRLVPALLTSLVIGLPGATALAQNEPPPPPPGQDGGPGGPGGPPGGGRGGAGGRGGGMMQPLAPDQAKTAWQIEAKHVAAGAGLSEIETTQLVAAYELTRENHNKAVAEIRAKAMEGRGGRGGRGGGATGGEGGAGGNGGGGEGGGEGGRGGGAGGGEGGRGGGAAAMAGEMQKAVAEATKHERESFTTALNGFLKPEQTTKVVEGLGSYDGLWDRLVWALSGLNLEADTMNKAVTSTQTYANALLKARDIADPQARREANTDARQKMQDEMKSILTEEQFTKFQTAAGPQAGGRAGPRGGGEGGQGGGRGGQGGGRGGQGGGGGNGGEGGQTGG